MSKRQRTSKVLLLFRKKTNISKRIPSFWNGKEGRLIKREGRLNDKQEAEGVVASGSIPVESGLIGRTRERIKKV